MRVMQIFYDGSQLKVQLFYLSKLEGVTYFNLLLRHIYYFNFFILPYYKQVYLEHCQTSTMKLLTEIVKS